MKTLHDFTVKAFDKSDKKLSDFRGKTVVVVNTASKCGFTPQYAALEALYGKYKDKGLVILAFPCNQFMGQEPGSDQEIQQFCKLNYGVSFPVMARIDVNGPGRDPLFRWLSETTKPFWGSGAIKWNFTKFLINGEGKIVKRYKPGDAPQSMEAEIVKLIG
jgi:glutathione peroxidase